MTPPDDAPLLRHAPATVHGRYFVRPSTALGKPPWFVGFHGQAQTGAAIFAPLARTASDPRWLVASVQGLNRYYTGRGRDVVANWMTREDREFAIADNIAWVDGVLDRLEAEFGAPGPIVFAGFSQGVAMAYRAGLLCRRECAAIITVGGDVPPELRDGGTRAWPRVLAMTGAGDEWFTPERLEQDAAFLRTVRPDAQVRTFAGGHEWADGAIEAAGALLAEITSGLRA